MRLVTCVDMRELDTIPMSGGHNIQCSRHKVCVHMSQRSIPIGSGGGMHGMSGWDDIQCRSHYVHVYIRQFLSIWVHSESRVHRMLCLGDARAVMGGCAELLSGVDAGGLAGDDTKRRRE